MPLKRLRSRWITSAPSISPVTVHSSWALKHKNVAIPFIITSLDSCSCGTAGSWPRRSRWSFAAKNGNHFSLGETRLINLASDADVVLMRQDPPFDMSYITATHLLEHVHPKTLVVNDPAEVRNAPEKLYVTHFAEFMPPTLIATDRKQILSFRDEHKDIIVKPLFGNGGAGVFHITPGDENLNALLEMFTQMYREPIIVQAYLKDVRQGDKRIILIDGEIAGATNRVPAAGEARSNMHVGGRAEKSMLTDRERDICAALGPELKKRGLIFVGIDVIGGYMTEINVTSPTGLQEINRFDDVCLEAQIWDAIETRL